MGSGGVSVTVDGTTATVTFWRPPENVLDRESVGVLETRLREVARRRDVRLVALAARGEDFCNGTEILPVDGGQAEGLLAAWHSLVRFLLTCEVPTCALVQGRALGAGAELALACDFIFAARHARFALPEVTRGIMPGAGATQNLPRAVGVRRAKEIIMSGLPFTAEQAHEWGMVNEVCDSADLMPKATSLAKTICDNAPISVRQIKKAINASMNMDLQSGLAFEIQCYERMISTEDRHEGVRAFNEKRKPQFKGR